MHTRTPLRDILLLAEGQGRVVSRRQLLHNGWTDDMIRGQLDARRWIRVTRGIYRTVTGEPTVTSWWWAAHLYGGERSRLADTTALQAWGLLPKAMPVRLAVPGDGAISPADRSICVVRHDAPRPVRRRTGYPPAVVLEHALLDSARRQPHPGELLRWISDACGKGLTTPMRIRGVLARRQRVRYRVVVGQLLAELEEGVTTPLERRGVQSVLARHGLPLGRGQVRADHGGRVVFRDRLLEPWGVVLEFDGRLGHADATGRFRDMARDNAAAVRGLVTLRFGWSDVNERPCEAALQVATVLACAGWPGVITPCGPQCLAALSIAKGRAR